VVGCGVACRTSCAGALAVAGWRSMRARAANVATSARIADLALSLRVPRALQPTSRRGVA